MRIIKPVRILGLICLFGCVFSMLAIADDNEDADTLFSQAISLITRAKVEPEDYSSVLEIYKEARNNINDILSERASSDLTIELVSGQRDISGYSLEDFMKMGEFLEILSAAEVDPIYCALIHAGRVYDPLGKFYKIRKIAGAYSRAGLFREAMTVANTITWSYEKGTILILIADYHAAVGEKEEASQLVFQAFENSKRTEDSSWKARLLWDIAHNFSLAGERGKMKELLFQLLESVTEMLGQEKDSVTRLWIGFALVGISSGFTEVGMFDEALDSAGIIENKSSKVEAITNVAEKFYELGKTVETEKLLNQAMDITNLIEEDYKKLLAVKALAVSYARLGRIPDALASTRLIEQNISRFHTLSDIVGELASAGKRKEAVELQNEALALAETFKEEHRRNKVEYSIAAMFVENGFYDEALGVTESISDSGEKAEILVKIAEDYLKSGEMAEVIQYLKSSIKTVDMMENSWEKYGILKRIASILAATGNKELLSQLLEITSDIEFPKYRAEVLGRIAEAYAELGEIEKASGIFSLALGAIKEISGDFEMDGKCNALAEIGSGFHSAGLQLKEGDKAVLRKLVLKAYPLKLFWERETQNLVFRDLTFLVSPLRR